MGFLNKKNEGGIMDGIRCDEEDYLIWKWRPKGQDANTTKKENSIRYGSSLNVKDGETAVFFYHQKDGTQIEYIEGPYNDAIKTENFPVLAGIVGLAFAGGTPFPAEVYYVNKAALIQSKFAVPYFDIFDPRFMDLPIPVAVRGSFSFSITDVKEFIKLHRLSEFTLQKFQEQIKDSLIKYIKGVLVELPTEYGIPVVRIESKLLKINELVENYVSPKLFETFGATIKTFDISVIDIDKESDGYQKCKSVTADYTINQLASQQRMTIQNQQVTNAMQLDSMKRTQDINLKNMDESLRIQRDESQYAQHLQSEMGAYASKLQAESQNLTAFGMRKQAEVGVAGAEAMGQMGNNGGINLGGSQNGGTMNPGSMMASMAMGQSVGMGMANMMNNAFGQMGNIGTNGQTVPKLYNVALNGKSEGPFTITQMNEMVRNNQMNANTLVWTNGMADWSEAGKVSELAVLFANSSVPPVPPPLPQ